MLEYEGDWKHIRSLLTDIALGRAPEEVLAAYLSARIIAAAKPCQALMLVNKQDAGVAGGGGT